MSLAAQRRLTRAAMRLFVERGATQVSVVDLAQAAGVARGTVYNNLADLSGLFDAIAAELAADMRERLMAAVGDIPDAAARLAAGLRLVVARAADEPEWGRFVARFGLTAEALRMIWAGRPLDDLDAGRAAGRYHFAPGRAGAVANLISSATFAAVATALDDGDADEAGAEAAEWALVALGLPRAEAREIARRPPPA